MSLKMTLSKRVSAERSPLGWWLSICSSRYWLLFGVSEFCWITGHQILIEVIRGLRCNTWCLHQVIPAAAAGSASRLLRFLLVFNLTNVSKTEKNIRSESLQTTVWWYICVLTHMHTKLPIHQNSAMRQIRIKHVHRNVCSVPFLSLNTSMFLIQYSFPVLPRNSELLFYTTVSSSVLVDPVLRVHHLFRVL